MRAAVLSASARFVITGAPGLVARNLPVAFFRQVVILSAVRVRASGLLRSRRTPMAATAKPGAAIGFLRLGLKSSLRMSDGKIGWLHFVKQRHEVFVRKLRPQVHVTALHQLLSQNHAGHGGSNFVADFPAAGLHLDYTRPNRHASVLLGWGARPTNATHCCDNRPQRKGHTAIARLTGAGERSAWFLHSP